VGQLVGPPGRDARVDDLGDPADDRLGGHGRHAAREPLGVGRPQVDLERLQRPRPALERAQARREHLDHADVGEHGLARQHRQEGGERAPHARRPRALDRVRGRDAVMELGEDQVVRGEEALLLVCEVVVNVRRETPACAITSSIRMAAYPCSLTARVTPSRIRSRWLDTTNSRGSPWRPEGSRYR
jgi:hypothetical protein